MGPLRDVKILEFGSIGPGPFAAMVLAGLGASVIRVQRPGEGATIAIPGAGADRRGRPSIELDLKDPSDRERVLDLVQRADAVIEGFRPGVMERLGLGPEELLERNPRLVYGRMTGYGQQGPLATVPGHDINYIAIAGALGLIARHGERPLFPLNLLGDYGGGGMLLALGLICAVLEARDSGVGQVVDAAMIDGVAQLTTLFFSFRGAGAWGEPGTNILDSGAPFYDVYETSDGGYMAVGAIEPQFYAELLRLLEIAPEEAPQLDRGRWPELKARFAEVFQTRTRAEWTEVFERADACTTPVLSPEEAVAHPHNMSRGMFVDHDGIALPASAPRFSCTPATPRTPATPPTPPGAPAVLRAWGVEETNIETLLGPEP